MSRARFFGFGKRRNSDLDRQSQKNRTRRMFFESLEARQLLVAPGDIGTIWETWESNYYPPQEFKAGAPFPLTSPSSSEPIDIAINYLKAKAADFGATANDFNHYFLTNQYTDAHNGVTHIYLQQKFNGLPVADAHANVHITSRGEVLSAGANFVRNLANNNAPVPVQPAITALNALATVGIKMNRYVYNVSDVQVIGGQSQKVIFSGPEISALSNDPITAELHYVPKPDGVGVEVAWKITAQYTDGTHWFEASVGAQANQRVNQIIRLSDYVDSASYHVYPRPVQDPLDGFQQVDINPQDPIASPYGWHDYNGIPGPDTFETRGNNVSAQEDINGDNQGGVRPIDLNHNYNFPVILPAPPANYVIASITNVFYWANISHDVAFHYGFDEQSGNFQVVNYSNVGEDNDAVIADAQDGGVPNNANMGTPPDGLPPRLQMGVFTLTNPPRDSSLDGSIISHEYAHGISNRLTGGPANSTALDALQSGGMGEGWSDWWSLVLTQKPGDTRDTPQEFGQWVLGGFGVRRFPYSYDMTVNGLTLDDFNGFDPITGFPNSEVHNAGEIWAQVLWDLHWDMIDRYGYDPDLYYGEGGNNLAMQLIFDGMKLQPANPSFLEARDAILAADVALTGGDNYELIWAAFARRGFGLSADDGGGAPSDVVTEAFDVPPPLTRVTGRVFLDANNNEQLNTSVDTPLDGWVIYIDSNNNGVLNTGERSSVTDSTGRYSLPSNGNSSFVIRQVIPSGYEVISPSSNSFTVNPNNGSVQTRNFLNKEKAGEIRGVKFNDLNGNGERDEGEPGIAGIRIYVDINQDGRLNLLEPAGITDASGAYRILNVPAGTDIHVREAAQPGYIQTFPDPADGGAHTGVTVTRGQITSGLDFGNIVAFDFGDAPNSYKTLLANNGPRHGILPGFGLGFTNDPLVVVGAEPDGQPSAGANLDTSDNGAAFLSGLTPGAPSAAVKVGVRTANNPAGFLQAWVDFNGDGDFSDAGEQIFKDRQLSTGDHTLFFPVPSNAVLGQTYARFRYGYERGLGPTGTSIAGEVEDLVTDVLQNVPVATPDVFPNRSLTPPDPFIKLNTVDNPLNVLRNDLGTTFLNPPVLVNTFPLTTNAGGTVKFQGPSLPLLYTPKPGFAGPDFFLYQVTDGVNVSSPARVDITVTPSDAIAIDDFVPITNPTSQPITNRIVNVLTNDIRIPGQTIKIQGNPVLLTVPAPQGVSLVVDATGDNLLFSAPANFRGTLQYSYTIDDSPADPSTAPSTATVTIQVTTDNNTPASTHLAQFSTQYLTEAPGGVPGVPTSMIDLDTSPYFYVQLVVEDLDAGLTSTTGVAAAYVDMLVQTIANDLGVPQLVEPVILPNGDFDIQFQSNYILNQFKTPNFSQPNVLNEIGATHDSRRESPPGGAGNDPVTVMTVKFRALGPGQVRVQADHADSPQLPVALFDPNLQPAPSGVAISDSQVFIQQAGVLTILPAGPEGEFSNLLNRYDVNTDSSVNIMDLLAVVNDLVANGPRSLNQFSLAISAALPSTYVDVNLDGEVNIMDLLGVVNYLVANGPTDADAAPPVGGEGEGEAEGESAPLAAAAAPEVDPTLALLTLSSVESSTKVAELGADEEVDEEIFGAPSQATDAAPLASQDDDDAEDSPLGDDHDIDAQAADELFGGLLDFSPRHRRRSLARG
jgi:hypothetical protein